MERLSDSEISMLLDTYMYFNYTEPVDGKTLREIVKELPDAIDVKDKYKKEYDILSDAVKNAQVGDLKVTCQAQNMGFNEGTNGVTFVDEKRDKVYVIYRGTADGEWIDNGQGLTISKTKQQDEAVKYFDTVVESLGITSKTMLTVSGHSKGANKAQYVTMDSKYSDLIDVTYSIDGQGHSKEAIEKWKNSYGEEEYERRRNKIYGINGENDYVSVLGISIINPSHISYIKTPAKTEDFAAYHDITRMFAKIESDEDGNEIMKYDSRRNPFAVNRGELGNAIAMLSEKVMKLPASALSGCAMTAMQIAEAGFGGRKTGLDGTGASYLDLRFFGEAGMPLIVWNLITNPDGLRELMPAIKQGGFSMKTNLLSDLMVDYEGLSVNGQRLYELAQKMDMILYETEKCANMLPFQIRGVPIKREGIYFGTVRLKVSQLSLNKLSKLESRAAELYAEFDAKPFTIT